jgi:hypothetical protein
MRYLLVACAGKDYSMPIGHTSLYMDFLTRLFLDRFLAFAFLTPEKTISTIFYGKKTGTI